MHALSVSEAAVDWRQALCFTRALTGNSAYLSEVDVEPLFGRIGTGEEVHEPAGNMR